jgi:bifunctional DNase/RNase
MHVEMALSRIIISELHDHQVVYLREKNGAREFPIIIGVFEASSIDRRVRKPGPPQRPLTHDLLVNAIEQLGGELKHIKIHSIQDGTYFAAICVLHGGEMVEIDARPSDAIAVAVTCDPFLPIFVNEEVIETALEA